MGSRDSWLSCGERGHRGGYTRGGALLRSQLRPRMYAKHWGRLRPRMHVERWGRLRPRMQTPYVSALKNPSESTACGADPQREQGLRPGRRQG